MKPGSEVFTLIKSLTKGEKRQFKINASGQSDKIYLQLFDVLDKMEVYDEKALKEKFKGAPFLKNLPVTKRYLMEKILESLRDANSAQVFNYQIAGSLADIMTFIRKGFYAQAWHRIEKKRQELEEKQEFIQLLILNRIENILFNRWYVPDMKERITSIGKEQERLIKIIDLTTRTDSLHSQMLLLNSQHEATDQEQKKVEAQKLIRPFLNLDIFQVADFRTAVTICRSFLVFHNILRQPEKSLDYAKKEIELYNRLKAETQKRFSYVLPGAYASFFIAANYCKRFEDYETFLNQLIVSNPEDTRTRETWALFRLSYLNTCGNFSEAVQFIRETEPWLKKEQPNLLRAYSVHFIIQFFRAYFGNGDFNNALKWNLKLLDPNHLQEDIYYLGKVNMLFCHFELGNYDLLESLLRSTHRSWKISGKMDKTHETLFSIFKKIQTMKNPSELPRLLQPFLNQIQNLSKESANSVELLDYEAWIRSKVERKPLKQVTKEKFLAMVKL